MLSPSIRLMDMTPAHRSGAPWLHAFAAVFQLEVNT
jgi:hypothetical protein